MVPSLTSRNSINALVRSNSSPPWDIRNVLSESNNNCGYQENGDHNTHSHRILFWPFVWKFKYQLLGCAMCWFLLDISFYSQVLHYSIVFAFIITEMMYTKFMNRIYFKRIFLYKLDGFLQQSI